MDYKTKYEEAIERAKRWADGTLQPERTTPQGVCETIFPELAENASKFERKVAEIIFNRQGHDDWPMCLKLGKEYAKELLELAKQEMQKENIEKEYVFRPLAGTDITSAALQAIRRANEGDRLVLAFNGAYIPVRKGCNANKIVDIYEAFIEKQKERVPENEEAGTRKEQKRDERDFTIYHPLRNGKGEYECIPYSFYGSLTSFSEDKDLIDFLRSCFYTEEECNKWIEQQKEQKPAEGKCYSSFDCDTTAGCTSDESEFDKGYKAGKAYQLRQTAQYKIGRTFMGLIPCWVNAPSTLQPAHEYHGKNAVIMHENNGGFLCCFIDDEKPRTVHLPENTGFAEGWRKGPAEIDERIIINKHITEDSISSDVNKRLKECGWYVTDEKPKEWSEEEAKKAAEDYADEYPGMTHENDGSTIEDYDKPYNDFMAGVLWAKHQCIFQNGNAHRKSSEEQMPVEWSEEDEKRVKQLIYDTEAIRAGYEKRKELLGERFNNELLEDCDEQIAWLKSLKNRGNSPKGNANSPHWKPSKEQMKALEGEIKYCYVCGLHERGRELQSLYDNLYKN